MNTKLKTKAKIEFEKEFFKLMNNAVFEKSMGNVTKQRDMRIATTNKRRNYLVSERNYHTTKLFSEHLLAIEIKNMKSKMNKPVYLSLSIPEISKTLMYDFWYDNIKSKYQYNAKLRYMDTYSFVIHIKTEDVYEDIEGDVEKRFDFFILFLFNSLFTVDFSIVIYN